jgi:hypothetical protein
MGPVQDSGALIEDSAATQHSAYSPSPLLCSCSLLASPSPKPEGKETTWVSLLGHRAGLWEESLHDQQRDNLSELFRPGNPTKRVLVIKRRNLG